MKLAWLSLAAAACLVATALAQPTKTPAQPPAPAAKTDDLYKAAPGPFTVKTIDESWHDAARNRDVPVRIYLPHAAPTKDAKPAAPEKFPVIVFSHGLGASRAHYGYFGEHMASWGYIVIAPTHAGSDTRGLIRGRERGKDEDGAVKPGGRLLGSLDDPDNLKDRPGDVSFVIDQLSSNAALRNVADTSKIGVAGHSFGAYTAMTIGGMVIDLPDAKAQSFRDERVKAVLPMSPEGPGTMGIHPGAWDKFGAPVLFLTGTRDYGQGERSATWRRAGFENVRTADDYLVTLNGATHMTFGNPAGPLVRGDANEKARNGALIDSLSAAFFDSYVRDDPKARDWLNAFFAAKHDDCTAEAKQPTDAKP